MAGRDLTKAAQILQDAVPKIIEEYEAMFPTRNLIVTCVDRSQEEQFALFKIGRKFARVDDPDLRALPTEEVTPADYVAGLYKVIFVDIRKKVTTFDGYKKTSKHITTPDRPLAEAVDFGVVIGGKYMAGAKDLHLYEPLTALAHKYRLIHGGVDFPGKWKDWPHVETEGPFKVPENA